MRVSNSSSSSWITRRRRSAVAAVCGAAALASSLVAGGCSHREAQPTRSASGGVGTGTGSQAQPPPPPQIEPGSGSVDDAPNQGNQPSDQSQLAGSSSPDEDHTGRGTAAGSIAQGCATDRDCACGTERVSGQCAVGLAARIDTTHPCPDFCSGIDGRQRTACERGRCVLTR